MFIGFYLFWKKKYRLIAADLSKQKALDADSRAIQQIIFTGKATDVTKFFTFSKSQKKPFYSFEKEQQKCCNYI